MDLRLVRHGLVDSTNERAFAALAAGEARHGDLHVADGQTAGRGRRGRRWESAPGEGLYLSLILLPPPPGPPPAVLTVAAGLAVLDAVSDLGLDDAHLKWPNDVVVGGAKLSGVLVEARGLDPERPHCVVGVGLNVAQRGFPAELLAQRPVTSLRLAGLAVDRENALAALARRLAERLDDPAADLERLSREYVEAARLSGRPCVARSSEGRWEGRLASFSLRASTVRLDTARGPAELRLEHLSELRPLDAPPPGG